MSKRQVLPDFTVNAEADFMKDWDGGKKWFSRTFLACFMVGRTIGYIIRE